MEIEEQEDNPHKEIPESIRLEIVHWKRQGLSGSQVSEIVQRPASTCNTIYRKWKETGTVKDKPRSGRPPKLNEEEEKMFIETVKANPDFSISQAIEESQVNASKTTGWRVLKAHGFSSRVSKEKWKVTETQRRERLRWAKSYIHMPEEYWFRVVFTDESKVQRNHKKQRYWIDSEMDVPTLQIDRWQPSVLIWGAIVYAKTSILEVIQGTMNSEDYLAILKRRLLMTLPTLNPKNVKDKDSEALIYQQDGASFHTTLMISDYFEERNIEILPWPPKSLDLSLIESVWSALKDKLKRSYKSVEELIEDIENQWHSIDPNFIVSLYLSMRNRIQDVINAKGDPTDY